MSYSNLTSTGISKQILLMHKTCIYWYKKSNFTQYCFTKGKKNFFKALPDRVSGPTWTRLH